MKNVWIVNILIEVQRLSPVCFGIWATGIVKLTANVHFPNTWKSSDLTSSFDLDTDHKSIGDRPLYNNFFVSAIKNLAAHLF